MSNVIHFQKRLQHPLCSDLRSSRLSLTFTRSEVTCRLCLEKLRNEVRGPVDWDACYEAMRERYVVIERKLREFFFANPGVAGRSTVENYPPQISLTFWFPAAAKSGRRKKVGFNRSPSDECDYVDVFEPTEDEMGVVATFVGGLAGDGLTPRRHSERRESVPLSYQLRPDYRAVTKKVS